MSALTLPFIGIQLGLFLVAVAASAWIAHPYRAEWRQAVREARESVHDFLAARGSAARQAAAVNKLAVTHRSLAAQAQDGAEAAFSDVYRQEHVYLRGLQHGQPEPTTEELYSGSLHQAELPGPVRDLQRYPDVAPGGNLAPLEWVSLDDLDKEWLGLQEQWQRQHDDLAWQAAERPGHRPDAAQAPSSPAGASSRGRPLSCPRRAMAPQGQVCHDRAPALPGPRG